MIRGTTRIYPVIGSPVAQVRAPSFYNPYFERVGIDAICVPLEVPPESFKAFLPALFEAPNVGGAMITVPHKRAAVDIVDEFSMAVRDAGACNAVVRRPTARCTATSSTAPGSSAGCAGTDSTLPARTA